MPSVTGSIVGPPSTSSTSAPITSSAITSTSTSTSSAISVSLITPLASSSLPSASSATVRASFSSSSSSGSRSAPSVATAFSDPSASANSSSETSSSASKPISTSVLAVICVFAVFAALGITFWLGKKCCIDRARKRQVESDGNANDNRYSEGWAKRMTESKFTGNREKFWHRLDDYHDSLKAREEGRSGPGQVVGGVVGKKRKSRIAPELMSMRMSAVPTFTHSRSTTPKQQQPQQNLGQTYSHNQSQQVHGNGNGPQAEQWVKNDNSSVKTFMIGNDDELAYLSTVIDDKSQNSSSQTVSRTQTQTQTQSFPVPSVQAQPSTSYAAPVTTPYDAPAGSYQLTPEDVGNAVTTSIPVSSSREKISLRAYSFSGSVTTGQDHHQNKRLSTISTISTGTGGVGNAMLSSGGVSFNEQSREKQPTQYLSTASAYLTPNYVPPPTQSQLQSEGRPQTDYRSPTESIYGCYKEDDDRHASFISTAGVGGKTSKAAGGVPAVPPIPAVYRQ